MGLVVDAKPGATMHVHLGTRNSIENSVESVTSIVASFCTSSFSPNRASYFNYGIASKITSFFAS